MTFLKVPNLMPALSRPSTRMPVFDYQSQSQGLVSRPFVGRAQYPQTECSGGHSFKCMYTHMYSFILILSPSPRFHVLLYREFPLTGCVGVSLAALLLTWMTTKENLSSICSLGEIDLNMQYYVLVWALSILPCITVTPAVF